MLSTCIPTDSFVVHIFVGTFFTNNSRSSHTDVFRLVPAALTSHAVALVIMNEVIMTRAMSVCINQ